MCKFLKKTLLFCILTSTSAYGRGQVVLNDYKLEHTSERLHHICEINHNMKRSWVDVKLDLNSLLMEIQVEEGTTTRGYAVMTIDPKNETSSYFLHGSTAPQAQQFNLVIGSDLDTAQFTRAHGAAIFTCHQK
jgi:hypothetical protein